VAQPASAYSKPLQVIGMAIGRSSQYQPTIAGSEPLRRFDAISRAGGELAVTIEPLSCPG